MDTIGFVCEPTHPVFWPVAERLAARGFDVTFLGPDDPVPPATLDELAAVVGGALRPPAFRALRYADLSGIPTWNGFVPTTVLTSRLVALRALERAGCRVPDVSLTEPERGDYVERSLYRVGRGGDGAFYQEAVGTDPVVHRYFAVDDGRETHLRGLQMRSRLAEQAPLVTDTEVDVALAARVRELLDRFGVRALAVDFAEGSEGFYALDIDPAPTFNGAEMDRRIADSVASLTTIGA